MDAARQPVIHACHVIHSLQRGGAEHLLVDLAAAGPAEGIDVTIMSLMPVEGHRYAEELADIGVDLMTLDLSSRWDPRAFERGVAAARQRRPDLIHTHLKHADLVGAWIAARLRVPMVSTLHLIEDVSDPFARAKRWAASQARVRRARTTITVSDAQRRWYLSTFPRAEADRVVTVRNGVASTPVDPDRRDAIRVELGARPDQVLVVMVGIMRPAKGHAEMVAAARRLPRDDSIVVSLVGDGPLRAELERAADGAVSFAGFRDDVAEVLAAADLVVHPTLADALPTALIHALAASRPIIASDVGGVPEIVGDDAGVLVPPGDVGALVTALTDLAPDAERREAMGRAGRARFDREFDVRRWAQRLRGVYELTLSD